MCVCVYVCVCTFQITLWQCTKNMGILKRGRLLTHPNMLSLMYTHVLTRHAYDMHKQLQVVKKNVAYT
jgi:hypothetical protein